MAAVHAFSLKVGSSHGLWQYKFSGTHERVVLHQMRHILNKTCQLLGYDYLDRSSVYLFAFSSGPFEEHQVCLQKMREAAGGGCYYMVSSSRIGDFRAEGLFPTFVRAYYLQEWPDKIYFKLEKSLAGGIVN